jgi:hypothetical protein
MDAHPFQSSLRIGLFLLSSVWLESPFGTLPTIHDYSQQFDYLHCSLDGPDGASFLLSNN